MASMRAPWLIPLSLIVGCHGLLAIDDIDFDDTASGSGGSAGAGGTSVGGGGTGGTTSGSGGGAEGGAGTGGAGGGSSWYDPTFGFRVRLTIDNTSGSEALTDFPLLVVLDPSRIDYAHVETDARDLRFVDEDDASLLDHEIDGWTPDGTSYVWVKVPTIPANDGTRFVWMYYGNSAAVDAQDGPGTWSNGYLAVWHLGATVADSTGNGHDGTDSGTVAVPGRVGRARQFDGTASYIDAGDPSSLEGLFVGGGSVSAWVRPSSYGGGNYGRVVDVSTALNYANGWGLVTDAGPNAQQAWSFSRDQATGFAHWVTSPGTVAIADWQHVAVTFDEDGTDSPALYLDGASQTVVVVTAPQGGYDSIAGSPMRIGNRASATDRGLDGDLDELRFSASPRTAGWFDAQHRSMTDTMVSFGAEQSHP
jgi:hypothetical protein